ncbi:PKD domain-containing protein [Actinokineospora cianjurensis]|uniref:PKD domain-containing protein n=1 Tax=Actinokineospora cianjurensis TaxID=585224 RepID=A0A421B3H4_9PSEU|nr:PKD domain-containing protein [Actinokineospora cianjurensis]RLK58917.1 PKD domain-containing protein [Actinokineospora cianjurensis]
MTTRGTRLRLAATAVAALAAAALAPGTAHAAPPSNDDFDNATAITLPFTEQVDPREATRAPDDPNSCLHPANGTAWYSFTSTVDTTLALDFHRAYVDTGVYTGTRGALALVPRSCSTGSEIRELDARAGVTYYLSVAANSWSWPFQFTAEVVPQPANDHFAAAETIGALPFTGQVKLAAATVEAGEPTASCDHNPGSPSVWYEYTPVETGSLVLSADAWADHNAVAAVYTGPERTELACVHSHHGILRAEAGRTLHIQFTAANAGADDVVLGLRAAEVLRPALQVSPEGASIHDEVRFDNTSQDPEGYGTSIERLDFGDGTPVVAPDRSYVYHRYAADGDYTARLTVASLGGRTATITKTIPIRTHDVAITGFDVPTAARVDATKPIDVTLANGNYTETVKVTLYRGTATGFQPVTSLTKTIRPNRTTRFPFTYTFTAADLTEGTIVFKATAEPTTRDALPSDNTVIAPATRVRKAAPQGAS